MSPAIIDLALRAGSVALLLVLAATLLRDFRNVVTGRLGRDPALSPMCCARRRSFSGLEPDRILAETTAAMPGAGLITWAMDYTVDRARKDVTVTLFGLGKSHAVYRGEGFGCYLDHGNRRRRYLAAADGRQGSTIAARSRGRIDRRAAKRAALRPRSTAPLPSRTTRRVAAPGLSWW